MVSCIETLERAAECHRRGDFQPARELYEQVLRVDPRHPDALHLLGVLEHQQDRHERAIDHIAQAIEINPLAASYHSNLGACYRRLGRMDQAVEAFEEALRVNPQFTGAGYNLAMTLEATGRTEEAIQRYRDVIRADPKFTAAYNNLGKLLIAQKRHQEAADCFRAGLQQQPQQGVLHYNLANVLQHCGEPEQAIENYRQAIQFNPDVAEYHNNLGSALQDLGETGEALAAFSRAVELNPDFAEARGNLVLLLAASGRREQATDHLRRIIELNPQNPPLLRELAASLRSLECCADAEEIYRLALQQNPEDAELHFGLGDVYQSDGRQELAREAYCEALRIDPGCTKALINLGAILVAEEQLEEAAECYHRALQVDPENPRAHYNLGNVHKDRGRHDEAVASYRRALEIDPRLHAAHVNLGVVLQRQGDLEAAIASHRRAIEISPDDAEAHFHASLALLLNGDYSAGWEEYEWRWEYEAQRRPFPYPGWDGSPLTGKTILVYAEQGVGDEVMFASCLPELTAQAKNCLIECDSRLVEPFARSFPLVQVFPRPLDLNAETDPPLPQIDCQIPLGSLPRYLRNDIEQFPTARRYLAPERRLRSRWRTRFDELGEGLKVGISWRGGNSSQIRLQRSVPLDGWLDLLSLSGVHFINLQYGDCGDELENLRQEHAIAIHDWEDADPLKDLENFAAQIAELDLVISVDNSTVHVAGAIGTPVWTLLPFAPNWRWLLGRENTPWYAAMKLFRQPQPEDWQAVFQRVRNELQALAGMNSDSADGEACLRPAADDSVLKEKRKYEKIWTHDAYRQTSFGLLDMEKARLIERLREHKVRTILDAGCGCGKLMQKLLTDYAGEFDVHGFDISENCLDPFFDDLKNDILTVGCLWNPDDLPSVYDAVLCTDVLEHIPTEHVPAVLENLRRSTGKICYLAIALFPDGFGPKLLGEPLHLTVREPLWWYKEIERAGFQILQYAVEQHPCGQNLWLHIFAAPPAAENSSSPEPLSRSA